MMAEGTSKNARNTEFSRGTSSYRAPEILSLENATYTNKVDIFALGCVLFEMVSAGQKVFANDFAVIDFARTSKKIIKVPMVRIDRRWQSALLETFRRMLDVDPRNRPSATTLRLDFARNRAVTIAEACLEVRQYEKALEAFTIVLELGVLVDMIAWKNLADVYKALEKWEYALDAYEKAILAGYPEPSVFVDKAQVLQLIGRHQSAVQMYKKALRATPDRTDWWLQLGDTFTSMNDHSGAAAMYRNALSYSKEASIFEKLGNSYLIGGDVDNAIEALKMGIKIVPSSLALKSCLLRAYEAKKERSKRSGNLLKDY